jgi:hypothetical protein
MDFTAPEERSRLKKQRTTETSPPLKSVETDGFVPKTLLKLHQAIRLVPGISSVLPSVPLANSASKAFFKLVPQAITALLWDRHNPRDARQVTTSQVQTRRNASCVLWEPFVSSNE